CFIYVTSFVLYLHGAGTVIPHLNFSISCAVLAPLFKFEEDMKDMEILQTLDQPNDD
ncbi:unnamed protein product, partial [Brassica oleracea var. botrytis]